MVSLLVEDSVWKNNKQTIFFSFLFFLINCMNFYTVIYQWYIDLYNFQLFNTFILSRECVRKCTFYRKFKIIWIIIPFGPNMHPKKLQGPLVNFWFAELRLKNSSEGLIIFWVVYWSKMESPCPWALFGYGINQNSTQISYLCYNLLDTHTYIRDCSQSSTSLEKGNSLQRGWGGQMLIRTFCTVLATLIFKQFAW